MCARRTEKKESPRDSEDAGRQTQRGIPFYERARTNKQNPRARTAHVDNAAPAVLSHAPCLAHLMILSRLY